MIANTKPPRHDPLMPAKPDEIQQLDRDIRYWKNTLARRLRIAESHSDNSKAFDSAMREVAEARVQLQRAQQDLDTKLREWKQRN